MSVVQAEGGLSIFYMGPRRHGGTAHGATAVCAATAGSSRAGGGATHAAVLIQGQPMLRECRSRRTGAQARVSKSATCQLALQLPCCNVPRGSGMSIGLLESPSRSGPSQTVADARGVDGRAFVSLAEGSSA